MNITKTNSNVHSIPRFARVAAICLASAGLVACGDDDRASSRSKEAFCVVEKQIDDEFNTAFAALGDNPTEEQAIATVVEVSKSVVGSVGDNYLSTAPVEIADDAALLWAAAQRAAAGNAGAYDEPDVAAAAEQVDTYCYGSSGS